MESAAVDILDFSLEEIVKWKDSVASLINLKTILCQLNHSDRCKHKSKLKNSLRLYSVNSKTNGRVCLHVILPPKTLSTVSAGEIGGTVQASNVPQKIVPPGKACAAVWGGAEERADASVAPEMNLQKYLM